MSDAPIQFPHWAQDPKTPNYKYGIDPKTGLRFNLPQGVKVAHPSQSKPMLKLMSRAFKGKFRKGKLFTPQHKKRKVRVI